MQHFPRHLVEQKMTDKDQKSVGFAKVGVGIMFIERR